MSEQRHIVISGASSGIGAALTKRLTSDGNVVYVCARSIAELEEITCSNKIASFHHCDVSQEEQVVQFVDWIRSKASHVDALINAAGTYGAIGPLLQTDSEEWRKAFEVNVFGSYLMIKHLVPLMRPERSPRIINFAGGGAFNAFPNYTAYAVSKAAVVRLTETLAIELKSVGIAVNAVAPGFVATKIHEATLCAGPEKAGGEHFEYTQRMLAQGAASMDAPVGCVRFLLSEQAHGLTGKTISANFDPWATSVFREKLNDINESELYTMRRINLVDLPKSDFRKDLLAASDRKGS
jgi:NAD(P)-dependent dehydrogenase (short-subunit alcohol dehydrogenase family)